MTWILAPVSFSKSGARRCSGSAICGPVNVTTWMSTPSKRCGPAACAAPDRNAAALASSTDSAPVAVFFIFRLPAPGRKPGTGGVMARPLVVLGTESIGPMPRGVKPADVGAPSVPPALARAPGHPARLRRVLRQRLDVQEKALRRAHPLVEPAGEVVALVELLRRAVRF